MHETLRLIVTSLVLPPGGPIVLIALGVIALRRCPRMGRALALSGVLALWVCMLPITAKALVAVLGGAQALDRVAPDKAEAIVILGGGVRPRAPEYGGDTLGRLTLERVRYGAYLAKQTGLPILVTGGAPKEGVRSEAELMREALEREYGLAVRWEDRWARNTRENAANSAEQLAADGRRRVLLVMHGFDVWRARRHFEAAGLEVIAAPTYVPLLDVWEGSDFLPSVGALTTVHFALYELLALGRETLAGPRR